MLLNFSFIHLVDTLAETLDLLAERIQQRFERFAVALLELPALLIEYFVGQILERQPLLLFECGDLLGAVGPLVLALGLQLGEFFLQRLPLRGTLGRVAGQRDQLGISRLGLGAKPALGLRPAAGGRAVDQSGDDQSADGQSDQQNKSIQHGRFGSISAAGIDDRAKIAIKIITFVRIYSKPTKTDGLCQESYPPRSSRPISAIWPTTSRCSTAARPSGSTST